MLRARLGLMEVDFLVDTGANASILPYDCVTRCGLTHHLDQSLRARLLNTVAEYQPTIRGRLRAQLHCSNGVVLEPFWVVLDPGIPILGMDVFTGYNCALSINSTHPKMFIQRPLRQNAARLANPVNVNCLIQSDLQQAGQTEWATLDTGSSCCFVSHTVAQQTRLTIIPLSSQTSSRIHTITGTAQMVGYAFAYLTFLGKVIHVRLCVKEHQDEAIIGLDALLALRLNMNFCVEEEEEET
ncbi:putative gag-polyprotein putative aspartyl protease-containing protein [Homarus americanus]|uniref:Putative gag-polyprotein putative aspartyl protease-containing protein n=1 Tax=Homarus americanus TaxID=6706 RepID=A0A8J5K7C1_HOMAM|nr:putative gag-polyprotein putative aspartyl protease-containing protein [Homarus americanus]